MHSFEPGNVVEVKPFKGGGWVRAVVVSSTPSAKGAVYIVRGGRGGTRWEVSSNAIRSKDETVPAGPRTRPSRSAAALRGAPEPGTGEARQVSTEGRLEAQAKPAAPSRSAAYLAAVRLKPCAVCQAPGPSDPHHWGPRGMGQKTDDFRTVPLCRKHHDEFHSRGMIGGSKAETVELFLRAQVDGLVEWLNR